MILQGTSYNEEEADKNRPQKRDRLFHFKDLSAGKTTKGGLDFEQKKKKQGGEIFLYFHRKPENFEPLSSSL